MSDNEQRVLEFLEQHGLAADVCQHPPVLTCEEADRLVPELPGTRTKNLFLRDRRGRRHFLVVIDPDQQVDLRALGGLLDASRIMFASQERLKKYLGIEPGSVGMLALLHDSNCDVELIVDAQIWESDAFLCHPMVNTSTVVLTRESMLGFLDRTGHKATVLAMPPQAGSQ